jgi:uncharacterized membrane protein
MLMTSGPSWLTPREPSREIPPSRAEPGRINVDWLRLSPLRCFVTRALLPAAVTLMGVATFAQPAAADFRLCNNTGSRVGIAIGYKDSDGWTTEGWWNLSARSCETLLRGTLVARFYYIYALDYERGGEWSGQAFMCTRDKEFTIRGIDDCLARGYERTGFFEVDTGEQRSWTVQLTESNEPRPPTSGSSTTPAAPAGGRTTPER